jgi:hypothetical protein
MKILKIWILFSAMLFPAWAWAQRGAPNLPNYDNKLVHFGFVLGINYAGFASKPVSDLNPFDSIMEIGSRFMVGFDVGLVANLHLGRFFDLRFIPTLSLLDRRVNYSIRFPHSTFTRTQGIESVNLDLPLLIRLKSSRIANNLRFYAIAGGQYSIDLASRSKKRTSPENSAIKLRLDDFQLQAGVGMDFYLQFFKFSIEAKMSFGMIDLLKREKTAYSQSVQYLRSNTFHISFLFEG